MGKSARTGERTLREGYDDGVAAYQKHLLAAAAIQPTDHVLDIGCGAGRTTRDAARQATRGKAALPEMECR